MEFKNDMTMMLGMHSALRRELVRLRRVVERPGDDPKKILQTAAGWKLFTSFLHVHHTAEDVVLWPAIRQTLVDDSPTLALLDAMEAEHATIDPLLAAVDAAVAVPDGDPDRLPEFVAALSISLLDHIDHEEREGLPLIDATVTAEVWDGFSAEHAKQLGPAASTFFPWVFDGAQPAAEAAALAHLPAPVQQSWRTEWAPTYSKLELWPRFAIDPLGDRQDRKADQS